MEGGNSVSGNSLVKVKNVLKINFPLVENISWPPILFRIKEKIAALAQMVACLPLVLQVRGSIPGGVVNFNLKIFNLGTRKGGDVHFLIARLYITDLD